MFEQFNSISSKEWKQKIQFELKGQDYNETLVSETLEGIKIKPFYHFDDNINAINVSTKAKDFKILQDIFVFDIQKSNTKAIESLFKGADSIRFTLDKIIDIELLMQNLDNQYKYYFNLKFLDLEFIQNLNIFAKKHNYLFTICIDPIGNLVQEGNWFINFENDFKVLNQIFDISFLNIQSSIYQNAGANMVQQLAYTMAHLHEYFGNIDKIDSQITIEMAIGGNYFFEIAKIRAMRLLFNSLANEYNHTLDCNIIAIPSKRNKTLYDYNVNMLRTTTECMSAILGGANEISNLPYDAIYHKTNEFGDRISRNQLLILKEESYFNQVNNPADGTYYIETITQQLAEKALELFKEIEKNGGFLAQLHQGTIQKKIAESAAKEQELFDNQEIILVGTNKYPNKNDQMKNELELFPFVKQNNKKTIISPIIEKRLAEKLEQERLEL
jgi:methylmalonyl-CoA mutase